MPFSASYDPSLSILTVRVEGAIAPEMLDAALALITSAAEYPPNVDTIWDFLTADFSAMHGADMRRMRDVRLNYPSRTGSLTALVVADDIGYGMSRMFQLLLEGEAADLSVTRSRSEAERWILDSRTTPKP